jgi:3'-5' exoribonuclease
MKSHFVVDLSDGQSVVSHFLVREKEVRTSARTGSSWLQLQLGDCTGTISGKMWDNFSELIATFECDDVIQVRGRIKLFNGQKEMAIEQIVPVLERDYDLKDFLPHTKFDIEKLYAELCAAVAGVENPWLKQLLLGFIEDPAIVPRLKRAPAAMTMHHAFLGGLLEHVVSLIGLAKAVSAHYEELDADLLLTGVVLHDIGKIHELRYTRGIDYSTEGRLLGHITLGVSMVRDRMKAIPGFPAPLAVLIEHMILSHHGSYEFGSPSLPQTREAVMLHYLDDMDSKMGAMRATIDMASIAAGSTVWTERNPSLRRALLRSDKFLSADSPSGTKKPAAGDSIGYPMEKSQADASTVQQGRRDFSRKDGGASFHG